MKYDDLIKQLLTEKDSFSRNFTMDTAPIEKQPSSSQFDYTATQTKEHDPNEIDSLWAEVDNIIGRAVVNSKEDLDKYLGLTSKVLVINKRNPHAVVIPGVIAKDILEKGQDEVINNIRNIATTLRDYMKMLGIGEFSKFDDGSIAYFLEPLKSEENLPISSEDATNENIEFLAKWVNWLKQKRSESWIIAGTDIEELTIN